MRVLVTTASRHGATAELAQWIAAALREAMIASGGRFEVDVRPAGEVRSVAGYDATVIGSAVYVGRWLDDARRFVDRHADALRAMPVWIFSSGPIGDPPAPAESPDTTAIVAGIAPRGHRVFTGRLDPTELGRVERLMVRAVKAPAGDYRDRAAVRDWAGEIAAVLREQITY